MARVAKGKAAKRRRQEGALDRLYDALESCKDEKRAARIQKEIGILERKLAG